MSESRSTLKECAQFLENQPSKWSWKRLVTSNDRKLCANTLQKRLSDIVKQMQVQHMLVTYTNAHILMHMCASVLPQKYVSCHTRTLRHS